MKIMPFLQWKNLAPPPTSSFSNRLRPIGRVMSPGIRDSAYLRHAPNAQFLKVTPTFLHPLSPPRAWQLRRSWSGWRGKGMDVIAEQGEQCVGRDVDAGMTST